jgi:hypothetical protein
VSVSLVIQHAKRMRRVTLWPVWLYTANPCIMRLIRSEKSSRDTNTRKVNNWSFFLQCYNFPLFLTLATIFVTIRPTSSSHCLENEWTTFYINRASMLNTPSHTGTGKMWPAGARATQSRHHRTRWLQKNYFTIFSRLPPPPLNRVIAKTRKVRSRITRVACTVFSPFISWTTPLIFSTTFVEYVILGRIQPDAVVNVHAS